jgi:hypothetical protein
VKRIDTVRRALHGLLFWALVAGQSYGFGGGVVLDLEALGADPNLIRSSSGQTFLDIGTTLGAPSLVGVTMKVRMVGGWPTNPNALEILSWPASEYSYKLDSTGLGVAGASLMFSFDIPVVLQFYGSPNLEVGGGLAAEIDAFGPAERGSLTSVHSQTADLQVWDDGIANVSMNPPVPLSTVPVVWESILYQTNVTMGGPLTHHVAHGTQSARAVILLAAEYSVPYCSGEACPCMNPSVPGYGCANSTGNGASLRAYGTSLVSLDDLVLQGRWMPVGVPSLFFLGNNQVNGGAGVHFGDGLLCVAGGIQRLQIVMVDSNGSATTTVPIASSIGASVGTTNTAQLWYRDVVGPCGGQFNTTNALAIEWF